MFNVTRRVYINPRIRTLNLVQLGTIGGQNLIIKLMEVACLLIKMRLN